ncbi:hypothetical protein BDL97_11G090600 [Sphagnum fallax]|nr:hypothetical protein BDL97_11G090600 [Sphagnum fallax]
MRRGIGPGCDCCSREAPQPPASSSLEREEERLEFEEKNKKKCLLLLLEHRALICTRRCPRISRLKLGVVVFITIFLLVLFLFFSHRVSLFVSTPNAQETGASVVFKLYRKNIRHSHGESGSRMEETESSGCHWISKRNRLCLHHNYFLGACEVADKRNSTLTTTTSRWLWEFHPKCFSWILILEAA